MRRGRSGFALPRVRRIHRFSQKGDICISDVHSFSHYSDTRMHPPSVSHARREAGGGCQKVTDGGLKWRSVYDF